MVNLLSDGELKIQFQIADFVLKTQLQIAKDFNSSGIFFSKDFENEVMSLEKILSEISQKLDEVMQLGESKLLQLLYQIDINQGDFLSLIRDPDFINRLSLLILKREAFKVFLRSKF